MGELLAEKARVAEEEAALLGKKASDAEEEIKRLRLCVSKVSHLLTTFPNTEKRAENAIRNRLVCGISFEKTREVWKCYKNIVLSV